MRTARSKAAILAQLNDERERLEQTIASLNPGAMLEPGVVHEWSAKDVLAHLADWEEHMPVWLEAARRGEATPGPEPDLTWHQLGEFNRRVFETHRARRLESVLDYFRTAHGRFMEMVVAMPEEEMLAPARYPLTGKQALYDWLVQYAQHDAWGTRRILEWLEKRASVPASEAASATRGHGDTA
ncbi:MAG TPA: ClbS/DfsB family four-helix bundle protein [Longimicrobiales bacterium]